ncbi:glycosyltransferase family 25 protein [Helicobacter salomonis]|uniref:glycosyltransferase family 25 protein n=1 Tax=Helicobacter salomonis TaxID=56878 RepID=UPI000CF0DFC3|nr:glycosyltransferase family 25 protein [Helicobacter salomonis]
MRVFVIHLSKATCTQHGLHERDITPLLEALCTQKQHQIEVFDAIYARSDGGLHPLVRAHAQAYFVRPDVGLAKDFKTWPEACYFALKFRGKMMSLSELGCYASHYTLWQHCVASQEPLCILEDDITLQPHFFESLEFLQSNLASLGWARLMHLFDYAKTPTATPGVQEIKENTCGSGAQGYCITPKIAAAFLAVSKKWIMPVDWVMENHYVHGIPNLVLEPFSIVENQSLSTQGNIAREDSHYDIFLRLLRELNRFYVRLQNSK